MLNNNVAAVLARYLHNAINVEVLSYELIKEAGTDDTRAVCLWAKRNAVWVSVVNRSMGRPIGEFFPLNNLVHSLALIGFR